MALMPVWVGSYAVLQSGWTLLSCACCTCKGSLMSSMFSILSCDLFLRLFLCANNVFLCDALCLAMLVLCGSSCFPSFLRCSKCIVFARQCFYSDFLCSCFSSMFTSSLHCLLCSSYAVDLCFHVSLAIHYKLRTHGSPAGRGPDPQFSSHSRSSSRWVARKPSMTVLGGRDRWSDRPVV